MSLTNDAGLSVITEGCKTSHGGHVLPVSRPFKVNERAVAVVGDMTHCPQCKGDFPIAKGDETRTWHDKPMAFHGHKTACGATLIAESASANDEETGAGTENMAQQNKTLYNEQSLLVAPPIDGMPYYIETMDGRTFHGHIGADGLLPRIDTLNEDEYSVYWGDEALAKMDGNEA